MPYVSLSRQYRPQIFDDVYGQQHVTRTLQNAIRLDRVGQAYLFCGPRGVGKTTVARILAKALNCASGPTSEPCGECPSCAAINHGSSLAVIEIDAASNRSIDDMRSLREDVQFAPTDGRRKIYILDEAHQITGPAFEAFLKTLEEPPAHAIFVLATTEPQKIPATILSRCQRFDFRRVGIEDIVARLRDVVASETLAVETPALYAIARSADGGLRDALSVLDQVIAYAGESVTAADVEAVLGTLDQDTRFALGELLAGDDVTAALRWLGDLIDAGRDPRLIVDEAIAHSRMLLLARLACAPETMATLPEDVRRRLEEQARRYEPARLMEILEVLAQADKALRWHPQPRILLETTLLDIVAGLRPLAAAAPRAEVPRQPELRPAPPRREPPPQDPEPPRREPVPEPPPRSSAPPPRGPEPAVLAHDEALTVEAVEARMDAFRQRIREGWPPLVAHLVHVTPVRVEGETVVLGFHGLEFSLRLCSDPERRKVIESCLSEALGRPVNFAGELVTQAAPAAAEGDEIEDLDAAVDAAMETFPGSRELET